MINKMISNSDILSSLFNEKEYDFLQEIDKKFDIIDNYKNGLAEKECGIKKLFESNEIDNEKNERVSKYLGKLKDKVNELETRIKELNQAIIRLVVNKETYYKYQTQDVKQTVCFAKDKIEEYMSLEKKFTKQLDDIDMNLSNILEGKEDTCCKEVLEESIKKQEKKDKKQEKSQEIKQEERTLEVPRKRVRQGSALNESKALKDIEEKSKIEASESKLKLEEKDNSYSVENNVLLISEKVGKVFLPYKKEDLQSYLLSYPNEYQSYNEVIEKEYILPLEGFMKNQTLSRFREMYDLIRNKELKSMIEAMKVSTKFMFRYELNPAIIAACNSKEELDKYLECLEQNKLEEFDIFDIKFELNLL